MACVFLVRHGSTRWNEQRIFRGRHDVPIDERGRGEVEAVAEALATPPIRAVHTSPLVRSVATGEAIAARHGIRAVLDPSLIDIDYGDWTGRHEDNVRREDAGLYELWRIRPDEVQFRGGESLAMVRDRAFEFVRQAAAGDASVVIVSHRVVLKVIVCAAIGLPLSGFWRFHIDTCSISRLDADGNAMALSALNVTTHLRGLAGTGAADF